MSEECPCHKNKVRSDLPPLTSRIARLPVDKRGYPVPFFVAWPKGPRGEPDFRLADPQKWKLCHLAKLCWVCGERLHAPRAFVIGPMCTVTRTTAEPPSHLECAEWSIKGCPFLTKPQMVRREDELTERHKCNVGGIMEERNPGVMAIWLTDSYATFPDHNHRTLIKVSEPHYVTWWREGRPATRAEVIEGIETGFVKLMALTANEDEEKELMMLKQEAMKWVPIE